MKRIVLALILIHIITSCAFHSAPDDRLPISTTTQVEDLVGTFKNKGDPKGYLSQALWGWSPIETNHKSKRIEHNAIELIDVSIISNLLIVKAISNKCVVYKKSYTAGHDFKINNGEIVLREESHLLKAPGAEVLGPAYEKIIIGIDTKGNGVLKEQGYIAGISILLLPIAASSYSEIRFIRVKSNNVYPECENR